MSAVIMDDDLARLINASGFAFQMAVEHAVRSSTGHRFRVVAREHPWRDKEADRDSFIDLVLESSAVTWVMECKRTKDATWAFLVEDPTPVARQRCLWIGNGADRRCAAWYDVNCKPLSPESQFCAVRGTGEGQQPMLERISATVIRSTDAIADQDIRLLMQREGATGAWGIYIPVIVTTATLKVCRIDPATIDVADGKVTDAEAAEVPMVRFRKTFTAAGPPNAKATDLGAASLEGERTVLVINAAHLVDVLQQTEMFREDPMFDSWPWADLVKELGIQ